MRLLTVLLLLILSFNSNGVSSPTLGKSYGAKTVELPSWFKQSFLDISEDISEAGDENRFVIIYFHQDGCPYCAKLIEHNFRNKALVAILQKNFDVIEINMWGDRDLRDWQGREFSEKEFAKVMRVQFTPTLLFLDKTGQILLRLNGYQSIDKMTKILNYISSNSYQKMSFSQYRDSLITPKPLIDIALTQPEYFDKPPFILSRSPRFLAGKKLAVIFTKRDCIECAKFYQNFIQNKDNEALFKQMQVVQLEINSNHRLITPSGEKTNAKDWYEKLKLSDIPALVFFDEQGSEIIRKDAYFKVFHFQSILHYVVDNGYKEFSEFQRYIEHRADSIRNTGQDVDIWE